MQKGLRVESKEDKDKCKRKIKFEWSRGKVIAKEILNSRQRGIEFAVNAHLENQYDVKKFSINALMFMTTLKAVL